MLAVTLTAFEAFSGGRQMGFPEEQVLVAIEAHELLQRLVGRVPAGLRGHAKLLELRHQ